VRVFYGGNFEQGETLWREFEEYCDAAFRREDRSPARFVLTRQEQHDISAYCTQRYASPDLDYFEATFEPVTALINPITRDVVNIENPREFCGECGQEIKDAG
jgi:hypothetical protein